MDTNKTGGAAFPHYEHNYTNEKNVPYLQLVDSGMTLLDYFAAKFAAAEENYQSTLSLELRLKNTADLAYQKAAAMIEERKKYI